MKRLLLLPAIVVALLVLSGPPNAAPPASASAPHSLSLEVRRPAGPPVLLQFEVRAADADEAYRAALRAAAELVPGGTVSSGSPAGVSAQWAAWGWTWDDAELPVKVYYNPADGPPTIGPDAVITALQTWSSVPSSRFAYTFGGFTNAPASLRDSGPDGSNVIAWQPLDCSSGCVLGVTTKETTHESDLILNSNPDAGLVNSSNGLADARSVILHETGHMAGLAHSCPAPFGACTGDELNAVMYYQYRGAKRKLAADDIAALTALYPAVPPPSGTPSPPPGPPPTLAQTISLRPGWNLTLLPGGPMEETMAALRCATSAYSYEDGRWNAWTRGAFPPLLTLTNVEPGRAYWVHATTPCAHTFG